MFSGKPENRWLVECSMTLCPETVMLLESNKLYDVTLERDDTIEANTETIDWTQFSLCGVFSCHHDYSLRGYRVKGILHMHCINSGFLSFYLVETLNYGNTKISSTSN